MSEERPEGVVENNELKDINVSEKQLTDILYEIDMASGQNDDKEQALKRVKRMVLDMLGR